MLASIYFTKFSYFLLTFVSPYIMIYVSSKKEMINCRLEQADQQQNQRSMKQGYECLMKMLKFLNTVVKLKGKVGQILSERASEKYMPNLKNKSSRSTWR